MGFTYTELIHYSDTPLSKLNVCSYLQDRHFKPSGLWFSVEPSSDGLTGKVLLESENFKLGRYKHKVKLVDRANILHLYDKMDLEYFTKEYGCRLGLIEWSRVCKIYKGIIIAPYCRDCRYNPKTFWYYTWDCACGCIWSLDAVESFTLLPLENQNT